MPISARDRAAASWAPGGRAQSETLASRAELEARIVEMEARFGEGLFHVRLFGAVTASCRRGIEFWQGRVSRLHDRFCYQRQEGDVWTIVRLAP